MIRKWLCKLGRHDMGRWGSYGDCIMWIHCKHCKVKGE